MILKIDNDANQLLDLPVEQAAEITNQVASLQVRYLIGAVSRLERALLSIRSSFQAKVLLESELIRLGLGDEIFSSEELEKRVEQLEQKVAALRKLAARPVASGPVRPAPMPGQPSTSRPVLTPLPSRTSSVPPLPDNVVPMNSRQSDPVMEFRNAVGRRSNVCQALLVNARVKKPENGILVITIEQAFAAGKLQARQKILQKPSIADAVDVFGGEIVDIEE
jgi:hypothetical protein